MITFAIYKYYHSAFFCEKRKLHIYKDDLVLSDTGFNIIQFAYTSINSNRNDISIGDLSNEN